MRTAPRLQSLLLLVALLVVIVAAFSEGSNLLGAILYLIVFSVAGYLLGARRYWLTAYSVLAVPALALGMAAAAAKGGDAVVIARDAFSMALQFLLMWLVFRFSLFDHRATRPDRIIAGICGYLILALFWANLYSILTTLSPGSLIDRDGLAFSREAGGSVYFSLITLSTVGYGDIAPVTPPARLLCGLEAITGTLYLAVFISSLVGGPDRRDL